MPIPIDVAAFAGTVALLFLVGIPLILKRVTVPRRLDIVLVSDDEFTEEQRGLFKERDAELQDLGFRHVRTARVENMPGNNLVRSYLSPDAWEVANLNLMRAATGPDAPISMEMLEFATVYGDGAMVITRNAEIDDVLDPLPDQIMADERGVTSARMLLERHRLRSEAMTLHGATQIRREALDDHWRRFHERWTAHNVTRGLLRDDGSDEVLRPTVRTALRGIRNFLNPFADNFTVARGLVVALVGLVFPVASFVALQRGTPAPTEVVGGVLGVSAHWVFAGAAVLILGLVGAVIGRLFSSKTLVWSFLIAYLPLRLVGGGWVLALALSVWTSAVASFVGDRRADRGAPI
jgi:hypothetical protein